MQNRNNTIWIIVGAVAAYLIIGWFSLTSQSFGVKEQTGIVWNTIETGGGKVGRIEAQYNAGGIQLPKDIVDRIVAGREALAVAKANNDIDGATKIASQIQVDMIALSEANAIMDTTPALTALIDETSEVFNQIGYQRTELIKRQSSYAFTKAIFFPLAGSFPEYGILGSNEDPARPMPTSQFAPTQAP